MRMSGRMRSSSRGMLLSTQELLHHLESPLCLVATNSFFGYRAVGALRLVWPLALVLCRSLEVCGADDAVFLCWHLPLCCPQVFLPGLYPLMFRFIFIFICIVEFVHEFEER